MWHSRLETECDTIMTVTRFYLRTALLISADSVWKSCVVNPNPCWIRTMLASSRLPSTPWSWGIREHTVRQQERLHVPGSARIAPQEVWRGLKWIISTQMSTVRFSFPRQWLVRSYFSYWLRWKRTRLKGVENTRMFEACWEQMGVWGKSPWSILPCLVIPRHGRNLQPCWCVSHLLIALNYRQIAISSINSGHGFCEPYSVKRLFFHSSYPLPSKHSKKFHKWMDRCPSGIYFSNLFFKKPLMGQIGNMLSYDLSQYWKKWKEPENWDEDNLGMSWCF